MVREHSLTSDKNIEENSNWGYGYKDKLNDVEKSAKDPLESHSP